MGLKQRGLVFATFFGSCIAIAFLLASLTTNQWVYSKAVRTNSTVSVAILVLVEMDLKELFVLESDGGNKLWTLQWDQEFGCWIWDAKYAN